MLRPAGDIGSMQHSSDGWTGHVGGRLQSASADVGLVIGGKEDAGGATFKRVSWGVGRVWGDHHETNKSKQCEAV
jgi:hypothetical protein